MRKVHIQGKEWQYRIGSSNAVIKSPDGKKTVVLLSKLTGKSWDLIERAEWKGYSTGYYNPSVVKDYIELVILGIPASQERFCQHPTKSYHEIYESLSPDLSVYDKVLECQEQLKASKCARKLLLMQERRYGVCSQCAKKIQAEAEERRARWAKDAEKMKAKA